MAAAAPQPQRRRSSTSVAGTLVACSASPGRSGTVPGSAVGGGAGSAGVGSTTGGATAGAGAGAVVGAGVTGAAEAAMPAAPATPAEVRALRPPPVGAPAVAVPPMETFGPLGAGGVAGGVTSGPSIAMSPLVGTASGPSP